MKKEKMNKIKPSELWDWDLSDTLARYILPRLKSFRKMKRSGVPSYLKTMKEWNAELDKMIYAFDRIVNPKTANQFYSTNFKVEAGLKSFAENFGSFWN